MLSAFPCPEPVRCRPGPGIDDSIPVSGNRIPPVIIHIVWKKIILFFANFLGHHKDERYFRPVIRMKFFFFREPENGLTPEVQIFGRDRPLTHTDHGPALFSTRIIKMTGFKFLLDDSNQETH